MKEPDFSSLPDSVTAPRTDPIYNCHSYLTKVPIAAIRPFIETFTKPGDTVVDFFAGSGMTGIAALSLGRSARLSDISVLGKHIADGFLCDASGHDILGEAQRIVADAKKAMGTLYTTARESDGARVEVVRTVWSFQYRCPSCSTIIVYYREVERLKGKPKRCPHCSAEFVKRNWVRAQDVPVKVVVEGEDSKQLEQDVGDADLREIRRAKEDERTNKVPTQTIDDTREMYSRSGLGKSGMVETRMFFSDRNAIALVELWNRINQVTDPRLVCKLKFAFTAILARASKRYQWSAKRPLNAQNQTYYIAPVYYEWNVFDLYLRKVRAVMRANEELFQSDGLFAKQGDSDVSYSIASADQLSHIEDASVDYVFTDPPFGSNIFYADMNLFHEAWLGKTTDHKSEAVVHTTGRFKKDAERRYERLLKEAFTEGWRVLKPGRYMSVVFGNSRGTIWGLVQRALRDAGFGAPVHVAILDKGQRSVKGLNSGSEKVVTVDLVLTVKKPGKSEKALSARSFENGTVHELIEQAILALPDTERVSPSRVYARTLQAAIREHYALDDLHLGDVLIALRNSGYVIDPRTGKLRKG